MELRQSIKQIKVASAAIDGFFMWRSRPGSNDVDEAEMMDLLFFILNVFVALLLGRCAND